MSSILTFLHLLKNVMCVPRAKAIANREKRLVKKIYSNWARFVANYPLRLIATSVALAIIALIPFKVKTPFNIDHLAVGKSESQNVESFVLQIQLPYKSIDIVPKIVQDIEFDESLDQNCYPASTAKSGLNPSVAQKLPNQGCLILSPARYTEKDKNERGFGRKISILNWGGIPSTDNPTISILLRLVFISRMTKNGLNYPREFDENFYTLRI